MHQRTTRTLSQTIALHNKMISLSHRRLPALIMFLWVKGEASAWMGHTIFARDRSGPGTIVVARTTSKNTRTFTCLGAKGLNRARNKQGDLKKKLELAKQQNKGNDGAGTSSSTPATAQTTNNNLSAQEIKERNDRLRFEELLKKGPSLRDFDSDGYLTKEQEEEEISASRTLVGLSH